jgi:uncharacterized protein (DUF2062 family)
MFSLPDCTGFLPSTAMPIFQKLPLQSWLYRRLVDPLVVLLRQGMSPRRLALCTAIAIVVGNIPFLGVSSILCTLIAVIFRLNLPAIQLVQAAMAPTQVMLLIPFVRLGEWMLRAPPQAVSIKATTALVSSGVWHAIVVLKEAIFHAIFAWGVLAPFCIYLFYRLLTPVFERTAAQFR